MAEFSNAENSYKGDYSWHTQTNKQIKGKSSALFFCTLRICSGEYAPVLGSSYVTFHHSLAMTCERRLLKTLPGA